jgi:hypothetical protein
MDRLYLLAGPKEGGQRSKGACSPVRLPARPPGGVHAGSLIGGRLPRKHSCAPWQWLKRWMGRALGSVTPRAQADVEEAFQKCKMEKVERQEKKWIEVRRPPSRPPARSLQGCTLWSNLGCAAPAQ